MLVGLSIRNVVLIDRLDLAFGPGLWALTGETGAGKSILLDALGLATGARADRGLVRQGADEGSATATFALPGDHPVWTLMSERGLGEGPELLLRRSVGADGRSRAFINDQPVSVATLREAGELVLEVHGQHDDRVLLNPSVHRTFLDEFGGLAREAAAVSLAWQAMGDARARLAEEEEAGRDLAAEEDYLRHALGELDELQPEPGEEAQLSDRRAVMMNAEKISADLAAARAALSDEDGFDRRLSGAVKSLERAAAKAPGVLDGPLAALDRALTEVHEATAEVDAALAALDFDERVLEQTEERLFALRAAARKYKTEPDTLSELRVAFGAALDKLANRQDALAELAAAARAAEAAYRTAAQSLSAKRKKAAQALNKAVAGELAPLKLDRAVFEAQVETLPDDKAGPHGCDWVSYQVATNPGAALGPLTQIASGGELARFILALRVALLRRGSSATMIFDEVDRGVGGAVADAVGERLARLADNAQVLVVTHSPQVAARAQNHLQVRKQARGGSTTATVTRLDGDSRREEIARMLSAAKVTDAARAAADQLLDRRVPRKKTGTAG